MPNEEIVEVEEILDLPKVEEGEEDTTDYKTLASQYASSAKRYKKLYDKEKIEKKVEKGVEKELEKKVEKVEKTEFDDTELLLLEVKNVPEVAHKILLEAMKSTGKNLRAVLGSKYIQAEIEEAKQAEATKNAIPTGTKRSNASSTDDVDYHYKKYEASGFKTLPDDFALKNKVIKERKKRENQPFSF